MNRRLQKGSALVESSLILLIFLAMTLGTVDFANLMFLHQSVYERTRKAVRYSVAKQLTADEIRNLILYDSLTTPQDTTTGYFGLTASDIGVTFNNAGLSSQRVNISVSNVAMPMISFWLPASMRAKTLNFTLNLELQ